MAEELPKRFDPLEKSEMRTLPTSPVRRRRAASVNALSPTRFELLDCSLADSSSSRPSPCEGDVSVRSPKIDQHSEVLPQVRQPSLPRGVRSLSFTIVFVLGFGCALLAGYLQPDGVTRPLREQALGARAALTKAFDEVLNSDTSEKLMNATWTLRQLVDMHSTSVTGRLVNATRGFSGIMDIVSTWNVPSMRQVLGRSERVGVRMQRQGLELKHPVVMIPGIITTGLEVWDGEECMRSYFRQRIWGTVTMLQSMMADPQCWLRHLSLNATTGLDPLQGPHFNRSIRVRPAQGFDGADFFLGGFWIWGLMIEALADIGYDINSMYMASYDWRLAFADLERRDRFFTRLRQQIETLVSMSGKKAVIVCHSMGGNVWHYFMQWVSHTVHSNWVNDYIHAEILVSSPLLGLPKAYYSLLTGNNRDFTAIGTGLSAVVNHFFGFLTRRALWRTCSSLAAIMPIGGDAVWGEAVMNRPMAQLGNRSLSMEEAYDLLAREDAVPEELQRIAPWLLEGIRASRPAASNSSSINDSPPEHLWANVLAVSLPFAPKMRKYAFYGVGVPTDFAGVLRKTGDEHESQQPRYVVHTEATRDGGFHLANGDYSCPVMTLGAMCVKGWKDESRNPAHIPCTVKEFLDRPTTLLSSGTMRGGASSGDHVDLLGNEELLADILLVASGGSVDERIVSNLTSDTERWNDS